MQAIRKHENLICQKFFKSSLLFSSNVSLIRQVIGHLVLAIVLLINYQRINSPILPPYFSYKSTWEKLLKYQENSPCVVISLILVTSGVEQALIIQGEI